MSEDDNKPKASKEELLGELESIKDLLNEENTESFDTDDLENNDLNIDIPILEDIIDNKNSDATAPNNTNSDLLNLNDIFDDDKEVTNGKDDSKELDLDDLDANVDIPTFDISSKLQSSAEDVSDDAEFDLELTIQELVDEFIPQLESRLHKTLSECSLDIIKALAKKHLK